MEKHDIEHVVTRLLRNWLRFKYNVNLELNATFSTYCSSQWDNSSLKKVLERVRKLDWHVNERDTCHIVVDTADDTSRFNELHEYVSSKSNSATFPRAIAKAKNGVWVLVSNAGHGMLQGSSFNDKDEGSVCIDAINFGIGIAIYDVRIINYTWYPCKCASVPIRWIPMETTFYKRNAVDVFRQKQLNSELEENMLGFDNVLS